MKKKIPALTSVTTARCDPDYLPVTSVTTLDHCHAGKDLHLRVLVQRLRYGAQGPGFQQVVGIHDTDDLVASGSDSTVHRHVDSRTRPMYQLEDRKSTRLNSRHSSAYIMPDSAWKTKT